jgi:hypothetical protein
LRARGKDFVNKSEEGKATLEYREHMNSSGSPSETVAAGYQWSPGTELVRGTQLTYTEFVQETEIEIAR